MNAPLLLAALLLVPHGTHPVVPSSLEDHCRASFEALRAGDVDALLATFPTLDEVATLLEAEISALPAPERREARAFVAASGGAAGIRARAVATAEERFEAQRARAAAAFDWNGARFLAVVPPASPAEPVGRTGFRTTSIEFLVVSGGEVWSFGEGDLLLGPRGWTSVDPPTFRGPRPLAGAGVPARRERP